MRYRSGATNPFAPLAARRTSTLRQRSTFSPPRRQVVYWFPIFSTLFKLAVDKSRLHSLTHREVFCVIACSRQLSAQPACERRINAVMTRPGKPRVQRVGAWLYALGSAVLTIVAFEGLYPVFRPRSLLIVFFVLWVLFSFVWRWVFFERGPELDKKIPVSSKELRRRKRAYFDDLQRP
jgi:hypothetical protein